MGVCISKEEAERRERKKTAPLHEGEFAIPDLAPGLRELVEKNDGSPAFSPYEDLEAKRIKYRVRLKGGYALCDAKNVPRVHLHRNPHETRTLLCFDGETEESGTKRYWRVLVYDTSTITEPYRKKGISVTGVVLFRMHGSRWVRLDSLWR